MLTFPDIMARLGHRRVPLVKLDIEGYEYGTLEEIIQANYGVRQVMVELHPDAEIGGKRWLQMFTRLFDAGFQVHAHGSRDVLFLACSRSLLRVVVIIRQEP